MALNTGSWHDDMLTALSSARQFKAKTQDKKLRSAQRIAGMREAGSTKRTGMEQHGALSRTKLNEEGANSRARMVADTASQAQAGMDRRQGNRIKATAEQQALTSEANVAAEKSAFARKYLLEGGGGDDANRLDPFGGTDYQGLRGIPAGPAKPSGKFLPAEEGAIGDDEANRRPEGYYDYNTNTFKPLAYESPAEELARKMKENDDNEVLWGN